MLCERLKSSFSSRLSSIQAMLLLSSRTGRTPLTTGFQASAATSSSTDGEASSTHATTPAIQRNFLGESEGKEGFGEGLRGLHDNNAPDASRVEQRLQVGGLAILVDRASSRE